MPPINPQGSRGGLIAALVTFVILFVTATIFAFNFYNQALKVQVNYDAYKKNYDQVLPQGALSSPAVGAIKAVQADRKFGTSPDESVIDSAGKVINGVEAVIVGPPGEATASTIADKGMATMKQAAADVVKGDAKAVVPQTNMVAAIESLSKMVVGQQAIIAGLNKQVQAAADKQAQTEAGIATMHTNEAKALTDAQQADAAEKAALNSQFDQTKAAQAATAQNEESMKKDISDAAAKYDAAVAAARAEYEKVVHKNQSLQARSEQYRLSPSNAVITQADGQIIRVANDVCYINIGRGKQVSPGLTFEVYNKIDGVPPIPPNATGDDHLPVGKASIEVTNVGDISSECRVVHLAPGAVLSEGDIIANLVYDPNTKFNFFVYGNFDMARNGHPSATDADVIKRLVTQWGGKITDKINADTDFVVLGAEPVVPNFSQDDLNEPLNQAKQETAKAALAKYEEFRQAAQEYHVPIMNQNRFLYYVGYFDQSKR